jgi:hypothetical protein
MVLHSPTRTPSKNPLAAPTVSTTSAVVALCILSWDFLPLRRPQLEKSTSECFYPPQTEALDLRNTLSQVSNLASFRLRRFSRPWRLTPPQTLVTFFIHSRPWGFALQLPYPFITLQSGIRSNAHGVAQAMFRILAVTTRGVGTQTRSSQQASTSTLLPRPQPIFQ